MRLSPTTTILPYTTLFRSESSAFRLHWKWLAGGRWSKTMALYRRGRIWYADYYANGERFQESTGTANKREAEKHFAIRVSEVQRGVFVKPVNTTLAELGERYIEYAKLHKRSWKRDVQMLGHLQLFFGPAKLRDITPLRVEEYQQVRVKNVRPATSNREMALLKHMFNMAERWGQHQGSNPVRLVKFLPEDNQRFETLSESQEENLLLASPPYLRDMILFAINTGLRTGDIFNLQWNEVDIEQQRLKKIVKKSDKPLSLPLNDTAFGIIAVRKAVEHRSEEHTSELQSLRHLVCRLLLR